MITMTFSQLTAKLGEDEAFADSLIAENEPLLMLCDEPMYYFYVERRQNCAKFLRATHEKAKQLVEMASRIWTYLVLQFIDRNGIV